LVIETDIQLLNPGKLIDLFVMDATSLGGDVIRWHGGVNPLGTEVVWQGNVYTRYPIEASGFERSNQGALPRPTLKAGNVTGLLGAYARSLDDLVGAKVTRKRTFAKYLDAINFPGTGFASRASIATYVNSSGVIATAGVNVARVAYDPVTLALIGPLYEQAATNLVRYSADIGTAPWAGNASLTADAAVSPDGTMSAELVDDTSAAAVQTRAQDVAIPDDTNLYTASLFLKAGTSSVCSIRVNITGGSGGEFVIDLTNGNAQWRTANVGLSFLVKSAGSGWYRVETTLNNPGVGATAFRLELRPAFALTYSPTLNAAATGSVLAWGAQLEVGAVATSYIPTAASAATRAADITSPGDNPQADPNAGFADEIWYVDRKAAENGVFVQFELAAAFDVQGTQLPWRQFIQNVCIWGYRSPECGYAGGPVADRNDQPTSDINSDKCGKRLASCKLRFGEFEQLPFGGFPGVGLVR
jgi:phage-related protein